MFFKHILKVIVYDSAGDMANDGKNSSFQYYKNNVYITHLYSVSIVDTYGISRDY